MDRITLIAAELKKRGITGKVTEAQILEVIRTLPPPIRVKGPRGYDDSRDPAIELITMTPEQRKRLSVTKGRQPRQTREMQVIPRIRPTIKVVSAPKQTLHRGRRVLGGEALRNLLNARDTRSDRKLVKHMITSFDPILRVRVQAVVCRNNNGKLSSGSIPQTQQDVGAAIDKMIDAINVIYATAGIEFIFFPEADLAIENRTDLNQDFILSEADRSLLLAGSMTAAQSESLIIGANTDSVRVGNAKQYPGKLVLLFAEGTEIITPATQSEWRWCKKCQGLFYGPNQASSVCPAGGKHDGSTSGNYKLFPGGPGFPVDPTSNDLQAGWFWCDKCQGMAFTKIPGSHCPAGGTHNAAGPYVLDFLISSNNIDAIWTNAQEQQGAMQDGWRYCKKCHGLFFGNKQAQSVCPSVGQHDASGSGNYSLMFEKATPRMVVSSPSSGGFSGANIAYAKLGATVPDDPTADPGGVAFISHEIGHYLHLPHTFEQISLAANEVSSTASDNVDLLKQRIIQFVEGQIAAKAVTIANVAQALDADAGAGILDTPPDDSGEYLEWLNKATNGSNACGPIGDVNLSLSDGTSLAYTPDRSLVMSYFKHCTNFIHTFSLDQAKVMRVALMEGNRRPLCAIQLGDTMTPNERLCAIWGPNPNGQALTFSSTSEEFKALRETMLNDGFHLVYQQAYTRAGVTLYDGIWNPSTVEDYVI